MTDFRNSLFAKAFLSLFFGVLLLCAAFYVFSVPYIREATTEMEENAARLHLDQTYRLVARAHEDLTRWQQSAMSERRRQLQDIVTIAETGVRHLLAQVAAGQLSEEEGRQRALAAIRNLKYGNNDYVWVANFDNVLIAHPDRSIENIDTRGDPRLASIVPPMVEMANRQGEGFFQYRWRRLGAEELVEKLAYFRIVPEWGWVIGTGVYVDDVDAEVVQRRSQFVAELQQQLGNTRIAGSGYMYIFDASGAMVVHPSENFDYPHFIGTRESNGGRSLFDMLVAAAGTSDGKLHYLWDRPDEPGNFVHRKIAWVRHFEPLGWYIASSVYVEALQASSQALTRRIALLIAGGMLLAVAGAYAFAWVFARPVQQLTDAARRIAAGEDDVKVDVDRKDELGILARAVAWMVDQMHEHIRTLETRVAERTAQLTAANAEMAAANARLRELDKMKSDFLSSVSHELRTPLTSIRGFAKLISRDFERSFQPLAKDERLLAKATQLLDNVGIIIVESERLTRLINDVLDLAKIESGRIDWHDQDVSPQEVVQQALNAVRGQFEQRPAVNLRVDLAPDLPVVRLDRDRLVQVLVNLLNNAAKFTERGEVVVSARTTDDGGIHIAVADSGCGFPPEEAEAVFDKFRQVSHGDTLVDKPQGTGLGLAICREIVGHYGGRMWAESAVGQGSTFHLTLPATNIPQPPSQAAKPDAPRRPDVLIVEDDAGVRSYLTQFFEGEGFVVAVAADGEEGVAAALALAPTVVIMDLGLPRLDGASAIRVLRRKTPNTPIIVVSGQPHAEQAGADVTITKPVDEERLLAAVRLLLADARGKPCERACVIVSDDCGNVPDFEFPTADAKRTEICVVADLPARLAAGIDGYLIVPVDLVDSIDLAETARQVPQVIIASRSRGPTKENSN